MKININPMLQKQTDDFGVHAKDANLRHSAMTGGPVGVLIARMLSNARKHTASTSYSGRVSRPKSMRKNRNPRLDTSGMEDSTNIFSGQRVPEQQR